MSATENSDEAKGISIENILPLEVIDKSIGHKIRVLLTNTKEFHGTLVGFDDYVNVVLENVEEFDGDASSGKIVKKMLLNGGQIAMLVPILDA